MKSNKAFAKRLRITKNGKIVARAKGQNHYNSKERTKTNISKRRTSLLTMTQADRARFLPGK